MRWPIQLQLLLPILAVVFLAIALATGAGAYLSYERARRGQVENLGRVVGTLRDATFPLSEKVLQQMTGLSGAEFLVLDPQGRLRDATLRVTPEELQVVAALPLAWGIEEFSSSAVATVGGQSYLGCRLRVPGRFATTPPGSLVVLYREDRWSGEARRAIWPALAAGGLASAVAVAVTALLARRLVRPIKQLCQRTVAIAGGQLAPMSVPQRNDEVRDLVVSINRMAEQLSRYERDVRRSERLRTLGQLGAGIAHQLRNAATGARMAIELHQLQCPAGTDDESAEVALRQLRLMESYLQRFLSLGQDGPAPHEDLDLAALVEDAAGLVRPACLHARIELQVSVPAGPVVVSGQKDALRELLVNLLLNAIDAAGRGEAPARVEVSVRRGSPTPPADRRGSPTPPADRRGSPTPPKRATEGLPSDSDPGATHQAARNRGDRRSAVTAGSETRAERAVVCVSDSGPGPAQALRDRLFEPFVTDKPEGTGVGLFVARRVAEAHGGSIGWSRQEGMTRFTVELPLHAAHVHGAPVGSR